MPWSGDGVLRVDIVRAGTVSATVRLAGEIDLTSVDAVRRAVADVEADTRQVILDLSRVSFCDLAGVRFLVEARHQAMAAGTDLVVRYPQRPVYRMLDLTGTLPLVCPDLAGAGTLAPHAAAVSACENALLTAIQGNGADAGNAQLVDPATGALRIVAQRGFGRPFLKFFEVVHDEESACGSALVTGTPVWVEDVASSPIFAGTPALAVMLGAGARAVGSVPVRTHEGGDVLGMISIHYRQPTPWTEERKERLAAVAAVTGRALSAADVIAGGSTAS